MKNKKLLALIFLLVILTIASFFRLWQLDSIPPGLYPDVAINGNDALDTLATKNFKLFYPENNGREGLFMWLIAFSFGIFGPSIWALNFVPAIFGVLTVLGLYLLTKELFQIGNWKLETGNLKNEIIALLASFFLAISFWHVNFSRIGFRAILVPFFLVFGFYCLFYGFRKKRVICFIISGILFGLGFYTYISYRFVVFLLAVALICCYLSERSKIKNQKPKIVSISCLLIFVFITALPIGIYFLKNPQDFLGRAAGVSIFNQKNPLYQLGKSIISHLGMFNFHGDDNWRHNLAGSPQLLWPIGIFFLIGLGLSIKDLVLSIKNRNCFLFPVSCFLLSWFFIMLLPGFLSAEGIPHALRVIGVIPVVHIFAAIGFYWLLEKIKIFYKTKKQIIGIYVCLGILLFGIFFSEFNKYFYLWAQNSNVQGAFSKNYAEIGNYLNSLPPDTQKYVIVNQSGVPVPWPDGIPMPAQTPIFIERTKVDNVESTYLLPKDLSKIKINKKTVIVPMVYEENLFAEILMLYPWGEFQQKNGFWIYEIE